jgi:F-type H+-transporting ATPase subunit gamma
MAGGQERVLRRRIRSVESTKKITRAMELIAASRIVRAQQAIAAARPYVAKMREVVTHLADTPDAVHHPLFRDVESVQRVAIVVITGDRGLAGGYNTSVIRSAERMLRQHQAAGRDVQLAVVGRKGGNYFRFRNQPIFFSLTGVSDRPGYDDARQVVAAIMEPFEAEELDQVDLVYTRFVSLGQQVVTERQLIPIVRAPAGPGAGSAAGAGGGSGAHQAADEAEPSAAARMTAAPTHRTDYEFEPEPAEILDRIAPRWLESEILAAMLEAAASEHAARQRAMKAATDNADELIKTLRRVMNRARQDAITTEIMEIVGGAEALRQSGAGDGFVAYHEIYARPAESA